MCFFPARTYFTCRLTAPVCKFPSPSFKNEVSLQRHSFSRGIFVCDDSRRDYQVQIHFSLSPFTQRSGVYFWSTYQSLTCLIPSLHLCLKCFTLLSPGADLCLLERRGGEKQRTTATICQEHKLPQVSRSKPAWSWSVFVYEREKGRKRERERVYTYIIQSLI